MNKLSNTQLKNKLSFINGYIHSNNAADGSKFDANANVSSKNLATMVAELHKDHNIQINRQMMYSSISNNFDPDLADEYIRQLDEHEIYTHDETSLFPYCVSVNLYPFLTDGLTTLGGESKAPKHLNSFCGSFVNLIFAISSQFAGAVATVEFLMYFDYFARRDYGDNYLETHKNEVENHLQHVVYALNQPAAARGYQSVFWNISVFDQHYFESLFGDFVFPHDFSKPKWETLSGLQEFFLDWFNNERSKAVLTFPVVTAAILHDTQEPLDKEFSYMLSDQLSKGNSFFIYSSDSADSLASCCRLRNELSDNTFSYSLGAGGVSTGSINVITMNLNKLIQKDRNLKCEVEKIQKYQVAYRKLIEDYIENGMLPVYDAGYISLDKQFLTIGINGMVEAAEFLGHEISNNQDYKDFISKTLKVFYDSNKEAREKYGCMFNTEFVPAENLGVKFAKWDKEEGLVSNRECYNSYFYKVEDENINILDKLMLHGKETNQYLDGGSAAHLNLEQYLTQEGFYKLIKSSIKAGVNYFCTNIKITVCNECGNISKSTDCECKKCGSKNIDYATRIIGYLKRISSWSNVRQKEEGYRKYHKSA